MGWTGTNRMPGMTDKEFFEREFPTMLGKTGSIVACATVRDSLDGTPVFYAAVRNNDDAPYKPGETWALIILIHRGRGEYGFQYKEMDENMLPVAEAPAAVLDALSDTDHVDALIWRGRCRTFAAAKAAKVAARPPVRRGDTVTFARPLTFADGIQRQVFTFVQRTTFTDGVTRFRISNWRNREYTVGRAA